MLPFSLYLLGLSFGPVLAAPLSETFGRKYVYVFGLLLFGLFILGSGFSQSITGLTICRFFAGFFSSPGLSLGTGTVSDVWSPETKGLPMSIFITAVQMGPALGPMIGGFLVENKSWRWTQWVILFALLPIFAITSGMDETYKRVILTRRARKLGVEGPQTEDWSDPKTIKYFIRRTIIRPLHMLFTETIVTLFDIYVAINFGILNAFFAAFPHVFASTYGFKLSDIGLTFLGQAVGSLCGLCIMLAFDRFIYQQWARALKDQQSKSSTPSVEMKLAPEQRLWLAMMGAPMLPISLFWFGWTARPSIHWISPVAAEALFSCGNLLIFTCSGLYLTDSYGAMYGASAWSSNTFLRYLFATAFPLFAEQMYISLGVDWASSLLGFVTLVLVPIPFAFYKWGPVLRRKSQYAPEH